MSGVPTAVVFVTDKGYLVPSIVAALQVVDQASLAQVADVFLLLIDFETDLIKTLEESFSAQHLRFLSCDSVSFMPSKDTFFNKTHVPKSALGRFVLQDYLPPQYENVVYIDGDTHILGDILPLLRHEVKPGFVAAVTEGVWLCEGNYGSFWRSRIEYLKGLGIESPLDYFNSGVLAFRLSTWRQMAPLALDYFNRNPHSCLYHDQSALNVVFKGKREVLSPLYNFASFYAELGMTAELQPRLAHFTGGAKPWFFPGAPWNGRFISVYRSLIERYPYLGPFLKMKSAKEVAEMERQQFLKELKRNVMMPWRMLSWRRKMRHYMRETRFEF